MGSYQQQLAAWWLDEHEFQIEKLRQQRSSTRQEYEHRDDQIARRNERLKEIRSDWNGLRTMAKAGMTELRGWDGLHERQLIVECRRQMKDHVRSWVAGDFVDYIIEETREVVSDYAIGSTDSTARTWWRPKKLDRVRLPTGVWYQQPAVFEWAVEDVTGTAKVSVDLRRESTNGSHIFDVLEVRLVDTSLLDPPLIEAHLEVWEVDAAGNRRKVTTAGPLVVRRHRYGHRIGWGVTGASSGDRVCTPFASPADGRRYEFDILRVWVKKAPP